MIRRLQGIAVALVLLTALEGFGYERYLERARPRSPDADNGFVIRATWPINGSIYVTEGEYVTRNPFFIMSAALFACAIVLNAAAPDTSRRRGKRISVDTLRSLPLSTISEVVFYKRDELTTDLIWCDVRVGGQIQSFHEEMAGWPRLLRHLEQLPGWREDWFASVSQPPFAESRTVAFSRV